MQRYIKVQVAEAQRVMSAMLADEKLISAVEAASTACIACLQAGGKILLAGNGGSAADSQHIAGEFVSRFAFDRPGLQAFEEARARGLTCIGFTGNRGGPMHALCDFVFEVPSADTPKIQEGHLVLGHILCGLVERAIFQAPQ